MSFATTDLCDEYGDKIQVADPIFKRFGGREAFCGPIRTVKLHEDNSLVRAALESPGEGHVLVVDGGGSLRCALLGDRLAELAIENGWNGVVVYGCVRDTKELAGMNLGVLALAAHPRRSEKRGEGQPDVAVVMAGVHFAPGSYLYADADGLIVAEGKLD